MRGSKVNTTRIDSKTPPNNADIHNYAYALCRRVYISPKPG